MNTEKDTIIRELEIESNKVKSSQNEFLATIKEAAITSGIIASKTQDWLVNAQWFTIQVNAGKALDLKQGKIAEVLGWTASTGSSLLRIAKKAGEGHVFTHAGINAMLAELKTAPATKTEAEKIKAFVKGKKWTTDTLAILDAALTDIRASLAIAIVAPVTTDKATPINAPQVKQAAKAA